MARGKKKEELSLEEKLEQALVPVEEWPYEVPGNWCWIHLLDAFNNVTDSKKKIATKEYLAEGEYPIIDQGQEFIGGYTNNEDTVYEGELPIVIFGDHTRCVKYIDFRFVQGADGVKVLRPKFFWDVKAFYYEFQSIEIPNMGYRRHYPLFRDFCIPIPPLNEQKRIVNRIEGLFAKLDEAKEKVQVVVDGFEQRKTVILHKAFTGELTERWRKEHGLGMDSWKKTTIGSISDVKGGKRVPKGMSLTTDDTGHPYIKAGNLKLGTVLDEGILFVPDDVLQYIKNYTVNTGDVYITNVGACIGDCGIIPDKYDGANLTENAVKMTNLKCNNKFLAWYISSDGIQQQIKNLIASATLGKLSIANIKAISISLPTSREQDEIVCILKGVQSRDQQVKEFAETVIDQIDTMKKAILARAFRGKLRTNDPTEESAVEMLKKIL